MAWVDTPPPRLVRPGPRSQTPAPARMTGAQQAQAFDAFAAASGGG